MKDQICISGVLGPSILPSQPSYPVTIVISTNSFPPNFGAIFVCIVTSTLRCGSLPALVSAVPHTGPYDGVALAAGVEDGALAQGRHLTRYPGFWTSPHLGLHGRKDGSRPVPCMEATYPYDIKKQRKARNAPCRELWVP